MDLQLDHICIQRPDFRLVANFRIASGEAVALIGPSGAGKSTLLNVIAGFDAPAEGRLLFGGRDMTQTPPAARPVAMVFQDNNLFPHLSVAQNVGLGRDPGLRLDADGWKAVDRVLERVGLDGFGPRRPATLSGGQQSRIALARTLLTNRPVLALDEPFAALGPALRHDMLGLVDELRQERELTVLMVTHDPQDARRVTPLTTVVASGEALAPQPTRALLDAPSQALADYLGPKK